MRTRNRGSVRGRGTPGVREASTTDTRKTLNARGSRTGRSRIQNNLSETVENPNILINNPGPSRESMQQKIADISF